MSIEVERVSSATPALVEVLNGLVPQLSTSAAPLDLTDLESLLSADAVTLFVAALDGVVVGSLTLAIFLIPTGWRAWIEDVVVDTGARGNGVGEALTNAAIDEARRRGARSIDLTSRPSREVANALYVKLGFERRETNVFRLSL